MNPKRSNAQLSNKVLSRAVRQQFVFKREKGTTSYTVFKNGHWRYAWLSTTAECKRKIDWSVNYETRELQQTIRKIRKLGFKVTLR